MTTIAYRDGVMAADSLLSNGHISRGTVEKVARLEDGTLVGMCGPCRCYPTFLEWYSDGQEDSPAPKFDDDAGFNAFAVRPDGSIWEFETDKVLGLTTYQVSAEFYATGSGWELALGAMAMGASAEEAIAVAARFDKGTGGQIVVLRHED